MTLEIQWRKCHSNKERKCLSLKQNVERGRGSFVLLGLKVPNIKISKDTCPLSSFPNRTSGLAWLLTLWKPLWDNRSRQLNMRLPCFNGQVVSMISYAEELNTYLQDSILQNWIKN